MHLISSEFLEDLVRILCTSISAVGVAVVIWGVAEAMIRFFGTKLLQRTKDQVRESENIRQHLGAHLLLGLEIFIAADIIGSVVSPTWDKVGILAAIVGIRTVLSHFLLREAKQATVA